MSQSMEKIEEIPGIKLDRNLEEFDLFTKRKRSLCLQFPFDRSSHSDQYFFTE